MLRDSHLGILINKFKRKVPLKLEMSFYTIMMFGPY